MAQKEHKIWITTGYGLEEYLTDARTKQIIEQIILPEFRNNDFYAGLDKGTTAIFQVLDGTFKGVPQHKGKPGGIPSRLIILFIIFIIIVISLSRGNKGGGRGGRRGRSTLMDAIILSSLGRGTFGGGGFGGGAPAEVSAAEVALAAASEAAALVAVAPVEAGSFSVGSRQ